MSISSAHFDASLYRQGQNEVISGVKSLSDKAMASAVAGLELATEVEASLRRAEEHFGNHLDEATDKQVHVTIMVSLACLPLEVVSIYEKR